MVNQLTSLVRRQAAKYGNREVFSHKDYSTNRWVSTSWNRFAEQVSDMAKAMVILGIREEENISTYTQNKPEGLIVDFAAFDNPCGDSAPLPDQFFGSDKVYYR